MSDERDYDLHRAGVGMLTSFAAGQSGLVSPLDAIAEIEHSARGYDLDAVIITLCGLAFRCCQLAAEGTGQTVPDVLALLGAEAATFENPDAGPDSSPETP